MIRITIMVVYLVLTSCKSGSEDVKQVCSAAFEPLEMSGFYKGNTHTHSENSHDSQEPVADIVDWYESHGYHFIVLTDHDMGYPGGEFGSFLVLRGDEVTSTAIQDERRIPVHANAICSNGATVSGVVMSGAEATLDDALNRIVDVANAIPQVNHPNYQYALTPDDINGGRLLEVWNAAVTNEGNETHLSTEELWDVLLSRGHRIYGVASDDMHRLHIEAGKGWIQVAAREKTEGAICEAIDSGKFYFSSGAEIDSISVSKTTITLGLHGDQTATFIGKDGEVLKSGNDSFYKLTGEQPYVRAKVSGAEGSAWTQPFYVNSCG